MAKRAVYEALGRLGYGQEKEGGKRETPQSGNGDRLLKILVAQMDDLELKRMRSRNHPDTARGEHDTDLYQIAVEEVDRRRRSA